MLVSTLQVLGPKPLEIISSWMNKASGRMVPVWNPYMPKGASSVKQPAPSAAAAATAAKGIPRQVVYLPSCVTRMMGPSASDSETASVHEKLMSLFGKAGYEVGGWLWGVEGWGLGGGVQGTGEDCHDDSMVHWSLHDKLTMWLTQQGVRFSSRSPSVVRCVVILVQLLTCMLVLLLLLLLQVILPKDLSSQCCGMMFNSRGLGEAAAMKGSQLEAALMEASQVSTERQTIFLYYIYISYIFYIFFIYIFFLAEKADNLPSVLDFDISGVRGSGLMVLAVCC